MGKPDPLHAVLWKTLDIAGTRYFRHQMSFKIPVQWYQCVDGNMISNQTISSYIQVTLVCVGANITNSVLVFLGIYQV